MMDPVVKMWNMFQMYF